MIKKLLFTLIVFNLSLPFPMVYAEDCTSPYVADADGKCVLPEAAAQMRDAAIECAQITDKAERDRCYRDNAQGSVTNANITNNQGDQNVLTSTAMKGAISGFVAYLGAMNLIKLKQKGACYRIQSAAFMMGAALAAIAAEVSANLYYKIQLRKAAKTYQEQTTSEVASTENTDQLFSKANDTQRKAFDYLIEKEKHMKTAATIKAVGHGVAGGLYLTAMVFGIIESMPMQQLTSQCQEVLQTIMDFGIVKNQFDPFNTYQLFKEINLPLYSTAKISEEKRIYQKVLLELLSQFSISSAHAQTDAGEKYYDTDVQFGDVFEEFGAILGGAMGGLSVGSLLGKMGWFNQLLVSPVTRASLSGVMAGYSTYLAIDAGKVAGKTQSRIDEIEKLKKGFLPENGPTMSGCKVEDRQNPQMPTCYCYLAGGGRDESKSNSPICKGQWGSAPNLGKTDYDESDYASMQNKGCVGKDLKVDFFCKCKKDKNAGGKNTCQKQAGTFNISGLGGAAWPGQALGGVDAMTNGDYQTGILDPAAQSKLAANIKSLLSDMGKNKKYKKYKDKIDASMPKLEASIQNQFKALDPKVQRGLAALGGASTSSALSQLDPKEAVKEVENDIKNNITQKTLEAPKSNNENEDEMDFNFGGNNPAEGGVVVEGEDPMNKDFDYGGNMDINQNQSASLFQVLSNRYQQSGLRRLFDINQKTEAPSASETDINK
jgi:hypothetical protein